MKIEKSDIQPAKWMNETEIKYIRVWVIDI